MKFVLLNRELHNAPIVSDLRRSGHVVFVCAEAREAEIVLKLHGSSISIVVAQDPAGSELAKLMKASPKLGSIPVVLTKSASDQDLLKAISSTLGTDLQLSAGSSQDLSLISPATEGISIGGGPLLEVTTPEANTNEGALNLEFSIDLPMGSSDDGEAQELPPLTSFPDLTPALTSPVAPEPSEEPTRVVTPLDRAPLTDETAVTSGTVQHQATQATVVMTPTEVDDEALTQMPYLQQKGKGISPLAYTPPLDDALVPGGAAHSPDIETLKKYLLLREQDVMALSAQVKQARDQIANLDQQLRHEKAVNSEFAHLVQEQGRRIDHFDREKEIAAEGAQKEIDELRFELKKRVDKARLLEHHVKEAALETERLKERVRLDIRKIRTREKELENRLEIMKKDSEALLSAREQKIVELKRKLDLTEFNMDLLQDQLEKEKAASSQLRAKLEKAAQVVRVAGGLLHGQGEETAEITEKARDPAA